MGWFLIPRLGNHKNKRRRQSNRSDRSVLSEGLRRQHLLLLAPPGRGFAVGMRTRLPALHGFGVGGWQSQILLRVGVADIANHWTNQGVVVRDFAILDVPANEVAEHTPEILVARIRHEGARVGDHANKSREKADIR